MHLTGRRFRRTMAENRSAYIVTEKGTYTANNQHFASYRPVIMSMLSDELQLSELSNTQFYKKISRVITGQYNSSQNRGGANKRRNRNELRDKEHTTAFFATLTSYSAHAAFYLAGRSEDIILLTETH